jgi:uncharacterized protein (DUF2267 family)
VLLKMNREQFLARVRREFPFEVGDGIEPLVQTVLHSLRRHITDGEWKNVVSTMPEDLAGFLA